MEKESFTIHWRYEISNGHWSEHKIELMSTDEEIEAFTDWVQENFYPRGKSNSIIMEVHKQIYFMFHN